MSAIGNERATNLQAGTSSAGSSTRDKAIRLFTYLKELTMLRSVVQRNCDSYEDVIWWAEIPREKECYCVAWDLHKDATFEAWIRVERPRRKRPPMPGPQLREWLTELEIGDSSLDAPALKETVVTTMKPDPAVGHEEPETVVKRLSEHPAITKQWELYIENEWWPWATEDRRLATVQTIYNELFAVYQKQKRLGESFEVVIGAGLLTWQPPHGVEVKRHVVVAQASVEFDESTGVISIDAAADGARPSLEQEMLEPQDRPYPDIQNSISNAVGEIGEELWFTPTLTSLINEYFQQLSPEGSLDLALTPQDGSSDRRRAQMHLAPALIVRRRTDRNLVRIFQEIADQLERGEDVPIGVQSLVEIHDDKAGELGGPGSEDEGVASDIGDLYLPLPTNDAQQQIVYRLETNRQGVLVQGPPGTGKSHTIVNLVCHLLATGRRILITSHTARALKVLKGYTTDHAPEVAPLCVSLLGDDSHAVHELEDSVQGILNRLHSWDSDGNRSQIRNLQKDLEGTRRELAEAMSELRQIRSSETEEVNLRFSEYAGTPQAIAERIAAEKPKLGWLQSFVPSDDPPPLTNADARELQVLIQKYDPGAESNPRRQLPEQGSVISPELFEALVKKEQELTLQLDQAGVKSHACFPRLALSGSGERDQLKDALQKYIWGIDQLAGIEDIWLQQAILDVSLGKHAIWQHLHEATRHKCEQIETTVGHVSEFTISGLDGHEISTLMADANILKDHIANGRRLGVMLQANPFGDKHVKASLYLAKSVRVNGRLCDNTEVLVQLLDWMHVATTLDRVETEWAEIQVPFAGGKSFQHRFHEYQRRSDILCKVLTLKTHIETAREHCRLLGLPPIQFAQVSDVRRLTEVVEAVSIDEALQNTKRDIGSHLDNLHWVRRLTDAHYLVAEAASAIESRDVDRFAIVASEIEDARKLLLLHQRRDELLSNLRCCALLKAALVNSASDSVWQERFASFTEAWNWCRANTWLQRFSDPGHERSLLQKIDSCQQRIRMRTQALTACKAWEFVLVRLKQEEREHLSAWKLAIRKIGKGTGKYAPQYRREARQHLDRCRSAIPAWVMPVYRVAETIRPEPGMFDVVIIDEASQSGPEALFLLYIAKKIVIVGDDQQISPESVGLDRDAVNALRERYIKDLPHEDALGVDNSFFEQAEIRFSGRIRLREHFRCMPEIIQFSNNLCYHAEPLVPLRQYGVGRLTPVLTRHVPTGYVKGSNQRVVNEPEAEAIVQQIVQCLSDAAYDKKTMGVISLQGSAQANLIRDLLMDRIGVQMILERNIVCGDAYAFQGDERDVIFLSMVAAVSSTNEPHRIGVLSKESDKRRFNVAASRAKDQMWLFHSVMLEDLSHSCFRRSLLEYCLDPRVSVDTVEGLSIHELRKKAFESGRANSRPPLPFDSWFEVDVFFRLVDKGFRVIPQYPLAGKRIDLLVEGMQGRLAVECDGDEWHGLEQWEQDVARQRMLERCGLEFWRVRGSTFYRDQEQALSSLWQTLEDRGIRPGGERQTPPQPVSHSVPSAETSGVEEEENVGLPTQQLDEDEGERFAEEESDEDPDESLGALSGASFDEVSRENYRSWKQRPLPDPHTASPSEVTESLIEIIEAEGPIVCRRAYALYNKAVGGARLGRKMVKIMNRAVYRAVRLGRVTQTEGGASGNQVLQLSGGPAVVPRNRGPRRLEEIPPSEIAVVREAIRTRYPSWDGEQMVRRLAEFYGIVRKTSQVRNILLGS